MSLPSPESIIVQQAVTSAGHGAVAATRAARARIRRVIMATVGLLILGGVWFFFVNTRYGQILDSVAMLGSHRFTGVFAGVDKSVLAAVSVNALVIMIVVAAIIAAARRRWLLGLRAVGVVIGATATTQILKQYVLSRPLLIPSEQTVNSLPSGHTTAACAVAAALVIVMPLTWRSFAAITGVILTALMGISTVINHWHRPSDVIAAVAIVAVWALLLAPSEAGRRRRTRVAPMLVYIGVTMLALAVACLGLSAWMLSDSLAVGMRIESQAGLEALAASGSLIGVLCACGGISGIVGAAAYLFGQLDRLAFR